MEGGGEIKCLNVVRLGCLLSSRPNQPSFQICRFLLTVGREFDFRERVVEAMQEKGYFEE